jgi:hypothetical protein
MSTTIASLKPDIRRDGRAWTRDEEFRERLDQLDGFKFEISGGKLFWSDEDRLLVVALLLENLGMDAVVRLGDAMRWKEAIEARLTEENL